VKIFRRALAVLVLGVLSYTAFQSDTVDTRVIFSSRPEIAARWEVKNPTGNVIGSGITAILRIESPIGVEPDLRTLPDVGESVDDLEVRFRTVHQYFEGKAFVTEITYVFQYLLTIDFSQPVTEKKVSRRAFIYHWWGLNKAGEAEKFYDFGYIPEFSYSLIRRVNVQSEPYDVLGRRPEPFHLGILLEVAGLLVLLSPGAYYVARTLRARKVLEEVTPAFRPEITDLYKFWKATGDYSYFVQAVVLYRAEFWGFIKPECWDETTAVVYRGPKLPKVEVERVFKILMTLEVGEMLEEESV
jgi:hypothetical protein